MHGRSPLCRRDAAAGSLHSGHSSVWPPRSPRLMGIHAGSSPSPWHPGCRQELPALFPAFAAKRLPARCECPVPASAGTSPAPTALGGPSQWGRGSICPPCSPGATRRGRCSSGMGLGVVLGAPTLLREVGTPPCGSIRWHSLSKRGGTGGCLHPTFGPSGTMGWGARTRTPSQDTAGGTDPTDSGSLACTGMAAPYPPPGLPVKAAGGCHAEQEPPLPRSLVLPGQELPGTTLSPGTAAQGHLGVQGDPHMPWGAAPGPPSLPGDTAWGDAVTFSAWQCRSHAGEY